MTANDHGRRSTYVNHGCRCAPCTEGNRKRASDAKARRRERQPPADAHGKASTYNNWGCRCDPCTTAHADYARARQRPTSELDLKEAS
jgi:hypothetical protein